MRKSAPDGQPCPAPDVWCDLAATVDRGGGDASRFWVDDSKVILRGGHGRAQLEATCLALIDAVCRRLPRSQAELLQTLAAGTLEETELGTLAWADSDAECCWPDTRSGRGPGEPTGLQTARAGRLRLADHGGAFGRARPGAFQWPADDCWDRKPACTSLRFASCFTMSGSWRPTAGQRTFRATSTAAAIITSSLCLRPSPRPGSTGASRDPR